LTLLFLLGCALEPVACGGDGGGGAAEPAKAAAAPSEPVEFPLRESLGSGASGTARLVQNGDELAVTLTLKGGGSVAHLAHIHTGPCSKEPTFRNPRIWVGLTDVVRGHSESVVTLASLHDVQAESASINVHDPDNGNRPLVCGDIPRAP